MSCDEIGTLKTQVLFQNGGSQPLDVSTPHLIEGNEDEDKNGEP